jgi:thiamine-phosphate pyrophosphorylase
MDLKSASSMQTSQAQAALRRKLVAAARLGQPARTKNGRPVPRAWFMTDPKRTPHPERIVARLPRGWGVIYRHFGAKDRFEVGARLAKAARGRVLLVSADPELAQAIRADGVHWPEARLRMVRARNPRWIETASAHSRSGLARAKAMGVDAVFLSPVFVTRSSGAAKPLGPLAFRALARCAGLPVYALGGIHAGNAQRALSHAKASRAAGWAAIDAIVDAWGG